MSGKVYDYLANDHRRLEEALSRSTRDSHVIEPTAYLEFRAGLLRHGIPMTRRLRKSDVARVTSS
jgi:hypothetical protein